MENNNENNMTAQESLNLINEVLNNSRKSILSKNGKHFILWGVLLTIVSFVIYELWHTTGNPNWNLLWVAMPIIGFPMVKIISKKDADTPQNAISRQISGLWLAYCAFVMLIFVASVFFLKPMQMNLTLIIVLLLGFTECASGIMLKNWTIIISGCILGVGGAFAAQSVQSAEQLLLFVFGGLIIMLTGLIVKSQYK